MNIPVIVPTRPAVIRMKRCETCGCATPAPGDPSGRALECHRNPPTVILVQTQQGPIPAAAFAPVAPDSFCVDGWRPKIEAMS